MREDRIISALIGLVGASSSNPKTENTDSLVIRALASSADQSAADGIVGEIYAEKNRISPGCARCSTPCGNTSDYDMRRIYNADEEIRNLKSDILSQLTEAAENVRTKELALEEKDIKLIYKTLAYVSYDVKKEPLQDLLEKTRELKQRVKEK